MLRLMERPHGVAKGALEWTWQLIAVEELGVAAWIWLGIRDDFRTWLIHAA